MLKLFDYRWLAVVMLLTVVALPVRTNAQSQSVVFSEIAWAGSSISASDEWIELTNVSDATIDLSGWTLTGAGSSGAVLTLLDGALVGPHSTYLIANYEHAHANSALAAEPNFVTATLSLPNGGFNLRLLDDGGALIDVAGGTGTPFAGRSGSAASSDDGRYASMVRTVGVGNGALPESWASANASQGFLAGVDDLGTPGVVVFAAIVSEPEATDEAIEEEPAAEEADEEIAEEVTDEAVAVSMLISEFVVDPNEGENEWIELVNVTNAAIDLAGWTLEDAAGKQTVLEGTVAAGEYLLVTAPLGKLNNDGDSILLKDVAGTLVDSVKYGTDELPSPKDGAALARIELGTFELTYKTTPGSANVIDPEKPIVVEEVETFDPLVESDPSDQEAEAVVEETSISIVTIIRINEFVADPAGDGVEWIELYNASNTQVMLEGWSIEDASGKATDLSAMTIEADGYTLIESPKGKLNNNGDTVVLKDASGAIVESVTYGGDGYPVPKDGESLARDGETFTVTELTTPGAPNLIFAALQEIENAQQTEEEPAPTVIPSETSEASEAEGSQVEQTTIVKTLRFITLYPNASGSDETQEYIELRNTGTQTVDLQDWTIEDGSTDRYTIEDSTPLAAGATIRLMRTQTKITLNNGGDTLELIADDGAVVDQVTYGNAAKGATYARVNGAWQWSATAAVQESKPAASNSTAPPTTSAATNASNSTNATYASSTTASRVAQSVTVEQAKTKADGQQVSIKGVVIVEPGAFGSQIFYLADETGGIQVYLYTGDFPELIIGDVVQLTGEMSTSRGERRVKLSGSTNVVPASGAFESNPQALSLEQIDELYVGSLIITQGQIQSKSSTKLILEESGATLTIYLKQNPTIDPNQFERGDTIDVTGVLTTYDGELRLRPRSLADIRIVEEALFATAVVSESRGGGSMAGLVLLFSTISALCALALWRYLPRRRLTPASA